MLGNLNELNIEDTNTNELSKPILNELKKINRNNPLPLYQQLVQSLYNAIKNGKLEPGSFFATELLLQKETAMSRSTIRKALEELNRRGLLVRITGKGTFVALPDVQVVVPELKSLTQELIDRGMKPGSIFLDATWTDVPEVIKSELEDEDKMLCVKRVRTGNGIPLLFSKAFLPKNVGVDDSIDLSESIYHILKSHGKVPYNATHTIKATIVSKEIAKLLGVAANTAGLFIQRKTYDSFGNFILYEEGVGRGDLYSYTLRMQDYSQF